MNRFILSILVALSMLLVSCEKHEGNYYLKNKCELELDGNYYIDQNRFESVLSPNSMNTPYLFPEIYKGRKLYRFTSSLAVDRKSSPCIYIYAYLFTDPECTDLDGKTFTITLDDELYANATNSYHSICIENGINFASVNSLQVSTGKFTFNRNDNNYDGTFELTFETDDGLHTAKGKLYNLADYNHE